MTRPTPESEKKREAFTDCSREQLLGMLNHSIEDSCETDTFVREQAAKVLSQEFIDGSSYYVPCIEDLVEAIVEKYEILKRERDEAREVARKLESSITHLRRKDWFIDGETGRDVICGLNPDSIRDCLKAFDAMEARSREGGANA